MNISLRSSYMQIMGKEVLQTGLNFVCFPFHNVDYYTITDANIKWEDEKPHLLLHQTLGFKTGGMSWVELEGRFGNLRNSNDIGGANIYNIVDEMHYNLGLRLKHMIFDHLLFSVKVGISNKTNIYGDIVNRGDDIITKENKYKQYNINGGLQWVF